MEQCWWNSVVEQCDSKAAILWWNSDGRLVLVEQWNSDRGTVLWNSETVMVDQCVGTVKE